MQNILLTEKKGFQSTDQQNHIQTFSPQKIKTQRNLVAMAARLLIHIPFDLVVLCRRSAPLPLAYIYIECAHYPQFYAPT